MPGSRVPLIACLALLSLAPSVGAAQEYVVDNLLDANDSMPGGGCDIGDGTCTLRAAIEEANAQPGFQRIVLGPGVHRLTISGDDEDGAEAGDLDVTGELVIEGAGPDVTIIEAEHGERVFDVAPDVILTVSDLAIQRGFTTGVGGGVRADDGALVSLVRVELERNVAFEAGGGVALLGDATLLAFETRFFMNAAGLIGFDIEGKGGAIHAAGTSSIHLLDSTLLLNEAVRSPAIETDSGPVTIERTTIQGHLSRDLGVILLSNNVASRILNSTLVGNQNGFAILFTLGFGTTTIENSTIVDNEAPYTLLAQQLTIDLRNSVVFNTVTAECAGVESLGHNASRGGAVGFCLAEPSDIIITDPLLGPLQDNGGDTLTRRPLPGSPLIDAGDDENCPGRDQRFEPRPQDGDGDGTARCDIGAVEVPEPEGGVAVALLALALGAFARRVPAV